MKWVGAHDFIIKETEIYFVTYELMKTSINKDLKDTVSSFTKKLEESGVYQEGYKNFLNSKECFKFGKSSVYSSMGMATSLLYMSFEQAWSVFSKIYPTRSKKIILALKKERPNIKIFEKKN